MRNKRRSAFQRNKNNPKSYNCNSTEKFSGSIKSEYSIFEQSSINTDSICLNTELENTIEEIPNLTTDNFNSVPESKRPYRKYFCIESAALLWRAKNQNSNSGLSLLDWSFRKNFNYFNELSQSAYWADKILIDINNELDIFRYLKESFFPNHGFIVEISNFDKKKEILGSLGNINVLKNENELMHETLLPCDSIPVSNPVVDQHGIFINSGSYIKKMCWVPINPELHEDQYLAVSVYKEPTERSNFYESGDSPNQIIQIYNCGPLTMKTKIPTRAQLEMILTHDWGKITDMAWSPQPLPAVSRSEKLIGHLAVCSTDGFIKIIPISKPSARNCLLKLDNNHPVLYLGTVRNKHDKEVFPVTMHWRQEFPDRIVAGYNTGHVGVFVLEACVFSAVAQIIGVNIYLRPSIFHRVFHSPCRSIQMSPFNWQLISCSSMTMNNAVIVDLGQPSEMILPHPVDLEATIGSKILWPIPGDVIVLTARKHLYNKPGVLICSAQKPPKRSRKLHLPDVSSIDLCLSLNILPIGTRSGQLRLLSLNTNYVNNLLKIRSFKSKIRGAVASKFYLQYQLTEIDSNETQNHFVKSENMDPIVSSSSSSSCCCPPKLQCIHKLSKKFSISISKTPITDSNNWQLDSMLNINEIATNPNPRCSTWIAVSLECGLIHIVPLTHFYRSELDQISTGSYSQDLNESANQLKDEILLPKNIVYMPQCGRPRQYPPGINYQQIYRLKRNLENIEKSIKSELDFAPVEIASCSGNLGNPLCDIKDFSSLGLESFRCSTPKRRKEISKSSLKTNTTSKSKINNISIRRNLRSNSKLTQIQNDSLNISAVKTNASLAVSTRQKLRSFTGFNVDNENEFIKTRSPSFESNDFHTSLEKDLIEKDLIEKDPMKRLRFFQEPLNNSVGDSSKKKSISEISNLVNNSFEPMRMRTRSFDQLNTVIINNSKSPVKTTIDSKIKINKSISGGSSELNISIDNKSIKSIRERLRSFDKPDTDFNVDNGNEFIKTRPPSFESNNFPTSPEKDPRKRLRSFQETLNNSVGDSSKKKSISEISNLANNSFEPMRMRTRSFDQLNTVIINNSKSPVKTSISSKIKINKSISGGSSELNISIDNKSIKSIKERLRSFDKPDTDFNVDNGNEFIKTRSPSFKSNNFPTSPEKDLIEKDPRKRLRSFQETFNNSVGDSSKKKSISEISNLANNSFEPMRMRTRSFDQLNTVIINNSKSPMKTSINSKIKINKSISGGSSELNISIDNKSIKSIRERLRSFDKPDIYLVTRSELNPPNGNKTLSFDQSDNFTAYRDGNFNNLTEKPLETVADMNSKLKRYKSKSIENSELNISVNCNKSPEPIRKRTRSQKKPDKSEINSKQLIKSNSHTDHKLITDKPIRQRLRSFDKSDNLSIFSETSKIDCEKSVKLSIDNKSKRKRKKSISCDHSELNKSTESMRKRLRSSDKSNINIENPPLPMENCNIIDLKIDTEESNIHRLRNPVYSFSSDIKLNMNPLVVLEDINFMKKISPTKKIFNERKSLLLTSREIVTKKSVKALKINETIENKSNLNSKQERKNPKLSKIEKEKLTPKKEIKKNKTARKSIKNIVKEQDSCGKTIINKKNPIMSINFENITQTCIKKDIIEIKESAEEISNEERSQRFVDSQISTIIENDGEPTTTFGKPDKDMHKLSHNEISVLERVKTNDDVSYKKPVPMTPFRRFLNTDIDEEDESDLIPFNLNSKVSSTVHSALNVSKIKENPAKIDKDKIFTKSDVKVNTTPEEINKSKIDLLNSSEISSAVDSKIKENPEEIDKIKIDLLNSSEFSSLADSTLKVSKINENSGKIDNNKISTRNYVKVNKTPEEINKSKIDLLNSSEISLAVDSALNVSKFKENPGKIDKIKIFTKSDVKVNTTPEEINKSKIDLLNSSEISSAVDSALNVSKIKENSRKIDKIKSCTKSDVKVNTTPKKINKSKIDLLNSSEFSSPADSTLKVSKIKENSGKIDKNKISTRNDVKVNKTPEEINKSKIDLLNSSEISSAVDVSKITENPEEIDKNKMTPKTDVKFNEISKKINKTKINQLNSSEFSSAFKISEAKDKQSPMETHEDSKVEMKKSKLQKANDERLRKLQLIMKSKTQELLNSQTLSATKPVPKASFTAKTATPSSVKSSWWGIDHNIRHNKLSDPVHDFNKIDDLYLKANFSASPKKKPILNDSCEDRMDKIKQVINRGISQSDSDCRIINDLPELLQPFRPLKTAKSVNNSLCNNS